MTMKSKKQKMKIYFSDENGNMVRKYYFIDQHGCMIGPFETKKIRNQVCQEHWESVANRQDYNFDI